MSRLFRLTALCVGRGRSSHRTGRTRRGRTKRHRRESHQAHGGEEVLTKHKATQLKTKGTLDIPGVGELAFTQKTSVMLPDKFRDAIELSVAGKTIPGADDCQLATRCRLKVDGKAVEKTGEVADALKDVTHVLEIGRALVTLKEKKYTLDVIGEDKVEGKKVTGIRVSVKDKKDVSLYFDQETWLLAKLEHHTVDAATGNEVTEERIVTEYKKNKNGVPVPKSILVKRDGKEVDGSRGARNADAREARRQRVQEVTSWRAWGVSPINVGRGPAGLPLTLAGQRPAHNKKHYFATNTRSIRVTFPCLSFTLTFNLPFATLNGVFSFSSNTPPPSGSELRRKILPSGGTIHFKVGDHLEARGV